MLFMLVVMYTYTMSAHSCQNSSNHSPKGRILPYETCTSLTQVFENQAKDDIDRMGKRKGREEKSAFRHCDKTPEKTT
jgi:hypothetical protein